MNALLKHGVDVCRRAGGFYVAGLPVYVSEHERPLA